MPLPQNLNFLLGAGVFGIVCAATLYVVEQYRQEQDKRRHAMARDLARLNNELAVLRKELDVLLSQQKQKYFYHGAGFTDIELKNFCRVVKRRPKRSKEGRSFNASSTTTEDYTSAVDGESSDLEFYDVSDNELEETSPDLDLSRIDEALDDDNTEVLDSCIQQLQNLCLEFPENPQLLWRLGKAHYRIFIKTEQQEHITKGIEACNTALSLKPDLANVHKWLAILVGERTKYEPIKEKILDGYLFKEHVDAAIKLNPLDASLHHMLGRFAYDVAELKWYERKVAATLFAEPPNATYEEALEHFMEAQRLSETAWKENLVFIAKCKIKLGAIDEAVSVLTKANAAETDNGVDDKVDAEIKELLQKYRR